MKIKLDNASESVRRLNPHLFVGPVAAAEPEQKRGKTLVEVFAAEESRARRLGGRVEVSIVAATHRRLDGDNLAAGCKPLRDAIARTLGLDDNDDAVEWQYGQVRCSGDEGTIVVIRQKAVL